MADKFSMNYAIESSTNVFSAVWNLTRVMKAAGWNVVAHSDGTTKTSSGTNANDSWGNSADPLDDIYPSGFTSAAPWIVMQGPSTIKLPFTSAPTGTFVRGEPVTQATSGATGELLGIVWDSALVTGWAIVAPRTGTFNGSNVVTGSISSATFTPSSVKTFVREVVFSKQSSIAYNGSVYYICADSSAESSSLFSTLAASAGCTATVQPGAGGTGNTFPTIAMSVRGTGGSVSHTNWYFGVTTSGLTGYANAACVNATSAAGVSADGSFYCLIGRTDITGGQGMFGFFRVDDGEPGDVDPYVFYWVSGNSLSAFSRTSATGYYNSQYENWLQMNAGNRSQCMWRGYASRDGYVSARDVVVPFISTYRNASGTTYTPQMNSGQPNPMEVQNQPSSNFTYVREPMGLCTTGQTSNIRMVKGNVRWVQVVPVGQYKDTFDNKKWIVVIAWVNAGNPGVIVGPWDGTTTPI